LKFKVLFVMIL